jgi:magnesium-transporting ATPase (P-type)
MEWERLMIDGVKQA